MQSYGSTVKKKSSSFKRASLQALKPQAASVPSQSQGFKLQAKVRKRQDPRTRVQAHKPMFLGASNKDKGIFRMFHVEANLVG
jgi:hypothetical protein